MILEADSCCRAAGYELSRRSPLTNTDPLIDGVREEEKNLSSQLAGTPERPLSDLGLRSFLAYWVATLIRALRRVMMVLPPDAHLLTEIPSIDRFPHQQHGHPLQEEHQRDLPEQEAEQIMPWVSEADGTKHGQFPIHMPMPMQRERWEGERMLLARRNFVSTASLDDGSARTDSYVHCTLEEIARLAGLRVEDAAFAMHEVGLLARRLSPHSTSGTPASLDEEAAVVMSREMIEAVARQRRVKEPELKPEGIEL
jgi:histone acetyltransferase MYST1